MGQKVDKHDRLLEVARRELGDSKIALKHTQNNYEELCNEIFNLVNHVDAKDWKRNLLRVYEEHVVERGEMRKAPTNEEKTAEELNRHLIQVEESLAQVTQGNEKLMRGKEKELTRKMKENSELVFELNIMRKREYEMGKERKEMILENARLKRELTQSMKSTAKTFSLGTRRGFTRDTHRDKSTALGLN